MIDSACPVVCYSIYSSPIGDLLLTSDGEALTGQTAPASWPRRARGTRREGTCHVSSAAALAYWSPSAEPQLRGVCAVLPNRTQPVLSIRTKMARRTPYAGKRAPQGRDRQTPAGSRGPSATPPVASAAGTLPADFDPPGNGHQPLPEVAPGPGPGSRRALKNWRVRSRLILLVAIPTVTAMILGGFASSRRSRARWPTSG